jgi:hypothetical protein
LSDFSNKKFIALIPVYVRIIHTDTIKHVTKSIILIFLTYIVDRLTLGAVYHCLFVSLSDGAGFLKELGTLGGCPLGGGLAG